MRPGHELVHGQVPGRKLPSGADQRPAPSIVMGKIIIIIIIIDVYIEREMCVYIYIYIYVYTHTYVYIEYYSILYYDII